MVNSKNKHFVAGTSGESGVTVLGTLGESQDEINTRIENGESLPTSIKLNFSDEAKSEFCKIEGVPSTDLNLVVHEMQHQYDYDKGNMKDQRKWLRDNKVNTKGNRHNSPAEKRAVENENRVRTYKFKRKTYGGKAIN